MHGAKLIQSYRICQTNRNDSADQKLKITSSERSRTIRIGATEFQRIVQQPKWIASITRGENNDILQTGLGRTPASINIKRAITICVLEKTIFFKRKNF